MRSFVDRLFTFSNSNREYVYLTEMRNVISKKMAAFATPGTAGTYLTSSAGVCIIRSGRGRRVHSNPHRDVLLPCNFRYERRIGYSFEIQNVS
jgi:hypothetical protein